MPKSEAAQRRPLQPAGRRVGARNNNVVVVDARSDDTAMAAASRSSEDSGDSTGTSILEDDEDEDAEEEDGGGGEREAETSDDEDDYVEDALDNMEPLDNYYHTHEHNKAAAAAAAGIAATATAARRRENYIPPLPPYRRSVVEPYVRPSTPHEFGRLYPSMNRLTIRHDEFTSDGNMNLRIDTVVTTSASAAAVAASAAAAGPGPSSSKHTAASSSTSSSQGPRRTAVQLFHLRMYDLVKRDFSLRRYCRDSGREVCSAKRRYVERKSADELETDKRTRAIGRCGGGGGGGGGNGGGGSTNGNSSSNSSSSRSRRAATAAAFKRPAGAVGRFFGRNTTSSGGRRWWRGGRRDEAGKSTMGTAAFSCCAAPEDELSDVGASEETAERRTVPATAVATRPQQQQQQQQQQPPKKERPQPPAPPPEPTDSIKLEFSNYARVDVQRRRTFWKHSAGRGGIAVAPAAAGGNSPRGGHALWHVGTRHKPPKLGRGDVRYDFTWWGRRYSWRRAVDPHLGLVGFHLVRDGEPRPIAHIVPESRAPNQVLADEMAGGWVPPCAMWIADDGVLDAVTDVGDVIMATGLIALVDDCIEERWQIPRIPVAARCVRLPLTSKTVSIEQVFGPKTLWRHMFRRRYEGTTAPAPPPPLAAHSRAA